MADSKYHNGVSPNSDTRLTNLSIAEHKKLEEEIQRQQGQVLKVARSGTYRTSG
jgi:hypothetical protein